MNPHRNLGHRRRIRNKIERYGINVLEDHELLEFLLFYVYPQINTNPIAHELISRFGSFSGVINADFRELEDAGLTRRAALWIGSMGDYIIMYSDYFRENASKIDDWETAWKDHIRESGKKMPPGKILLLLLNANGQIIFSEWFDAGKDWSDDLRIVCSNSVKDSVYYAVTAHTYPPGTQLPDEFDRCLTSCYAEALRTLNITLLDRVCIIGSECIFYSELGADVPEV